MKTVRATEASQKIIDILKEAHRHFKQREIWWRGQRLSKWKLDTGIWRRSDAEAERDIMNKFRRKALSRHAKCPDMWDNAGWLFLLQHYGLQTRLLDWTESLLIAIYFAVKKSEKEKEKNAEKEKETGALYALSPFELNKCQFGKKCIFSPDGAEMKPLVDRAFNGEVPKCEKVAAIHSREIDVKLMVQQSVFTIHGFNKPLDEIDGNENFLMKFEIEADLKKDLYELLYEFGIHESTVFPDLEHLANEFRQQKFHPV